MSCYTDGMECPKCYCIPCGCVKPYTRDCDLDAVEAEMDLLVKNEDVEEAANTLDRIARRLLATVRAGLADTERAEWLLARLWYGGVDVEPEQGVHRFLKLTDDEGRLRRDWRELIDGMRPGDGRR